jgi:nanoRNase/pAp phosphatase (c-di-AMP/oligoRNAs hydrolase)
MEKISEASTRFNVMFESTLSEGVTYLEEAYNLAISNPIVTLIVIIAVTGVGLVTVHYAIQWLKSDSDRLLEMMEGCETVTVLMHNNPDPDAMACAMAIKRLAHEKDVETEIAYPGRISHDENRAFRAVLNVDFNNIKHAGEISGEKIILVDQYEPRGVENGDSLIPNAVIDHHSVNGEKSEQVEFWHVEESVGACSSILTGFLDEQGLVDPEGENTEISEDLATALYHGIKSDTDDISKGVSNKDFKSINLLYKNIGEEKLYRISNPKVDGSSLETKARAIMGREVRGPFAVSDVGEVTNTDSIPQAADEIIRLEGISAAVVIGTSDDSIRISGRAYDDRIHLGNALRRAVQEVTKEGTAGGHAQIAGGSIPKKSFDSCKSSRSDLIEKMFDVMNGK